MSAQHTPGPWLIRENGLYLRVVHGEHKTTVADNIVVESYARLIAVAPDLLTAGEAFVKYDQLLRKYDGPLSNLCAGDVAEIDAAYDALVVMFSAALSRALGEGERS